MKPPPDVIIIRGAPGVGKTSLSKELASHFPRGVRLEVDALRGMVISVDWTNQQQHKDMLTLAAHVTKQFLRLGLKPVIVVDTFSGDKVAPFIESLKQHQEPPSIQVFALHASPEDLAQRLHARPEGHFKDAVVSKKLNADVLKIIRPEDALLDTSCCCPKDLAAGILRRLNATSISADKSEKTGNELLG